MKTRILFIFLTLGVSLFANRSQDIVTFLEPSFFPQSDHGKMMFRINAAAVLQKSQKEMDLNKLIDHFFEQLDFLRYHDAFEAFSDEELNSIVSIFSDPAYLKMIAEAAQIHACIQQNIDKDLNAILEREGTQKALPVALDSETEVIDLTKENFFEKIILAKKPMIIDFSGKHCGPCHLLAPIFEKLNAEFGNQILFFRLECNEAPEIAKHFNIRSIPALVFLKPNDTFPKIIKTTVGFKGEESLREEIDQFLSELD